MPVLLRLTLNSRVSSLHPPPVACTSVGSIVISFGGHQEQRAHSAHLFCLCIQIHPHLHKVVMCNHVVLRVVYCKKVPVVEVLVLRSYSLTARPGPLGRLGVPMITCCRLGDNDVTL